MKRREFIQAGGGLGAMLGTSFIRSSQSFASHDSQRPNILWITCEDISPHLGCYGDHQARTPNLDRLASEGARFDNAYSVSGVCAPSRSCLITGMYPTSLATNHMRCRNQPPEEVRCFPEYLRRAGYYCTNNRKEDYNFKTPPESWDESSGHAHFRNRPRKDQPFFAVFNFTITHESKVGTLPEDLPEELQSLLPKKRHDPNRLTLPPYYPDTPLIRKHWAHYYDLITAMDRQAGQILAELEEDGLSERTIVFFFSDHGVGLPRAKRWLYDSGLHVPFLVRWPGKIPPGAVRKDLVSFVDFAPTVLSLAGVPVPSHMQGKVFLGQEKGPAREFIFAARDRMDERYDLIRAVRNGRFKYIRNYQPYRPYDQYLHYPEHFPVMAEMRRLNREGKLKGPETLFFRQSKPLEELYDTARDPHEIRNLAGSPEYGETLNELRDALEDWMERTGDRGFIPEMELPAWLSLPGRKKHFERLPSYKVPSFDRNAGKVFGHPLAHWVKQLNETDSLSRLRAVSTIGLFGEEALPVLVEALKDPDSAVVHWAAISLGQIENPPSYVTEALVVALARPEKSARLGAAYALCRLNKEDQALGVVLEAINDPNESIRLLAVQVLEMLPEKNREVQTALKKATEDTNGYVKRVAEHALETAAKNRPAY